jgi:ABC-type multidrug transport system ATPase subunit
LFCREALSGAYTGATNASVPEGRLEALPQLDPDFLREDGPLETFQVANASDSSALCSLLDMYVVPTGQIYREKSVSVGEGLPSSELSHSMLASLEKLLNEKARKEGREQVNIAAPSGLVNTHSIVTGAQLRCPAGYQCMPDLTMDVFLIASVGVGACSPCIPGTYCPQGSMNDDGLLFGSATVNLCPPGFYCPDPTQIFGCPAGYFCPSGSVRPYSCTNMTFQGVSLVGNFCPSYSPTPFGVCRAGHYCPDASQKIVCPRGYFCPPQSIEPQKCPPLSACQGQKRRPEVSFSAVIGILTVIFGLGALVLLYSWWLRRMQARKLDRSRKEGRKWTLMKTLGTKLGATSDQMASISKYNSFSTNVTQINVVVENLSMFLLHSALRRDPPKKILDRVNLTFPVGSLNAILGSSGAGKTTLLKAVVGKLASRAFPTGSLKYQIVSHNLTIDVFKSPRIRKNCVTRGRIRTQARARAIDIGVGYVPQDNLVQEILTVYENILFSAKMRLPERIPMTKRKAIVWDTIAVLGLSHIQGVKVGNPHAGGISGGECRRVSIGVELAACPSVLILDEPTSGLDSAASNEVMSCLKKMANLGVTVVASIHQPRYSTFLLFDYVHLLLRGGKVVYSGPAKDTEGYFRDLGFKPPRMENPADFFLDVMSGISKRYGDEEFDPTELPGLWENRKSSPRSSAPGKLLSQGSGDSLSSGGSNRGARSPRAVGSRGSLGRTLSKSLDDSLVLSTTPRRAALFKPHSRKATDDTLAVVRRTPTRLLDIPPTPRWLEMLGEQFDAMDPEGRGYINKQELSTLLEGVGQNCTVDEIAQLVEYFDLDGDGKIERREYLLRWTRNYWTQEFSSLISKTLVLDTNVPVEAPAGVEELLEAPPSSKDAALVSRTSSLGSQRVGSQRPLLVTSVKGNKEPQRSPSGCLPGMSAIQASSGRTGLSQSTKQFFILIKRDSIKWVRQIPMKALDFLSIALVGAILGIVKRKDNTGVLGALQGFFIANMFLGILSAVWSVQHVGRELNIAQREAGGAVSVPALFSTLTGLNSVIDVVIRSLVFSILYHPLVGFSIPYGEYFFLVLGVTWSTSGLGYLSAVAIPESTSMVFAVSLTYLMGGVLNGVEPSMAELRRNNSPIYLWLVWPSYARWAAEAMTLGEYRNLNQFKVKESKDLHLDLGYREENWFYGLLFLYISGAVYRLLAYFFFQRRMKQ